eukprot:gene3730-2643_t
MIIHSAKPTSNPTTQPSGSPTGYPTSQPSRQPSRQPSSSPSGQPTSIPTSMPTLTWDTRWKIYLTGLFESKNRSASFYLGDESYRLTYYDLVVNQARYFGGCEAWETLFAQQMQIITSSYTMKQLSIYSQTGQPGSDLLKASCSDKDAVLSIVDNAALLQRQLQANATMAGITSIVFSFLVSFPVLFVMFYYYDRYRGGKGERVKDVSALKAKHVMEPFLALGSFGSAVFGDSVKLASQSFDFLPPLHAGWSTADDEHAQLQKDISKANAIFRPLSKFVAVWKWSTWMTFWSTWSKLWRKHWVFQVAVGNRRQLRYAFALRLFSTVCWVMFITMSLLYRALPPNDTSCQVYTDQASCEDRRSYLNDHKPVCRWITSDTSQVQFANAPEAWCRWYQRKLSGMEWIKLIVLSLLCIGAVESVLGSVVFDGILAVMDKPLNHLFGQPPAMEEVAEHFTNREPQTLEEFNRRQEQLRHPTASSASSTLSTKDSGRTGPLRWFHRLIGRPLRAMKMGSSSKVEADPTRGMFAIHPGGAARSRSAQQESKMNSSGSNKGKAAPSLLSYRSDADMGNFEDDAMGVHPKRLSAVLPVRAVDLAQERRKRQQPLHLPPLTVDNMRQKYERVVENTPVSKILFDQMIAQLFHYRETLPPEAQQWFDQEWSEIGLPISYLSPFFEAIHAHIDRDAKEFHYFATRKQMLIREELERVRAQAHCLGQHLLVEHAAQTNEDIQLLLLVTLIRDVLGWHSLESHLFVRVMNERFTAGSMYPLAYLSARAKWAVAAVVLAVSLFLFCWSLVRIRDFSWDRQWDWWILVMTVLGANLLVVQLWETIERQVIYRALFARQWTYVEDFLSINLGILKRSTSPDAAWAVTMPRGSSAAETYAFWYAWCHGFDEDQAVYHPQRFPHYAWYQHPWYYPWQPLPRGASLWWHLRFRVGYLGYLVYAAAVFVLFQGVWMVPARLRLMLRWYTVRTPVVLRLFVKYMIVSGCLFGSSVMYTLVHHNRDASWIHSLEIPRQTAHDDARRWWVVSVASFAVGALTLGMYASALYPVLPPLSWLMLLQSLVNGLVTCISFIRRLLVTLCCCCLGTKAFLSAETAPSRGMDGTGGLHLPNDVVDGSDSDDSDGEEGNGEGVDGGGDGLDADALDRMQSMEEGNSRDAADDQRRRRRRSSVPPHASAHSRAKSVHFHGEQHPSLLLEGLHGDGDDGGGGSLLAADDDDDVDGDGGDFADGLFLDDLANLRDSYGEDESDDGKRSDSYHLGSSLGSLTGGAMTAAIDDDRSVASNASHIRKALSGLALHSPMRTKPPTLQTPLAFTSSTTAAASMPSPLSDEPEPNSAEGLKSLVSNKPLRMPPSPLKLARPGGLAPKPNAAEGPSDSTSPHPPHQRPLVRTSPLRSVAATADHSQAEDDDHGDYSSSDASSDED